MKILLIYSPVTVYGSSKIGPQVPMGLLYLGAYLEKKGHEVKVLDALFLGKENVKKKGNLTRYGLSEKQIIKEIKKFKPDIVGVSVMYTAYANDAYEVAKLVKKADKKIITVLGGAHVSIDPKEPLKIKEVDYTVKGEGEISFINLIEAIKNNKSLNDVTGISYRKSKKIISNPDTPLIKDLDTLPFPGRHLIPIKSYIEKNNKFVMSQPVFGVVTSRGCPNHCVYCSIHSVWNHSWRGRSAKNVVDEIEELVNVYGAKELAFMDDSMSVDKKRMNEICDEIIKRKIKIKWSTPNGIAHWTLDKKLLKKMKKAGCYRVTFGIESGDLEMRRWVGKPYNLEQAKELTKYANKIGMWTIATNIIGFPYETKEQVQKTIDFSIKSDVDFALFYRLSPRIGTPVYEVFKKEGWLPKDKNKLYSEEVCCETKNFKGNELFELQSDAYKQFFKKRMVSFMNPIRVVRKIHSLQDLIYVKNLGIVGIKLVFSLFKERNGITSKSLRV